MIIDASERPNKTADERGITTVSMPTPLHALLEELREPQESWESFFHRTIVAPRGIAYELRGQRVGHKRPAGGVRK